jgi:hypothetical protein
MALPPFSFTVDYFAFILSVTIASLLMMILGGWITNRMQKGGLRFAFANKSTVRKKFFGFLLFVTGIFLLGWLSERLQQTVFSYVKGGTAGSITSIIVAFVIAWFMYDWLVWRKHNS